MDQWLYDFFASTAWPMTPPAAFGPFHLIWFFVGVGLCFLLAWLFRNANEKQNRAILLTVGLFLLISEIYKQLFYYYYIGQRSYQWWIFPFQLCSVPMYLCLIAPFCKKGGRLQRGMYNFMMIFNLLGGFAALIEISGLVHEYWTLTLHAFIWHTLLVFVGLYLGISGRAGTCWRDYFSAAITFVVLCAIAFALNVIFGKVSDHTMNMFFVGPENSSLVVFKTIAARYGWYVSTALYIPVVCLGAMLFFLPFYLLRKAGKLPPAKI